MKQAGTLPPAPKSLAMRSVVMMVLMMLSVASLPPPNRLRWRAKGGRRVRAGATACNCG